MKRLVALVVLVLLAALPEVRAESQDEQYVAIYNSIQQADYLNEAGQMTQALAKYLEAQTALKRFQAVNPEWNTKVVSFRLKYLEAKIIPLASRTPATNVPPGTVTIVPPAAPKTEFTLKLPPPAARPAAPSMPANQLKTLEDEVRQLTADKTLLQAKLKEALAVQPAVVDPRELTKAEERIKSLLKENELLKAGLAEEQARSAAATPAALAQNKQALAEAMHKLSEQTEAAAALRAENDILKKQVADLRTKQPSGDKAADLSRQLAQAETQIAALQSDKEIARLEKIALENRIKQLSTTSAPKPLLPATPSPEDAARIRQLERERDELQKKLDVATKELYGRKGPATAARVEEMTSQLEILRARLEVFEARQVPYTEEELALFKPSPAKLAAQNPKAGKKSVKELPEGAGPLVAQAQSAFAAQRYEEAEQKYLQVLRLDEKNVYTLGNLAAIQLELNHLDAAERNLKQALEIDPNDAFSLSLMGYLKFQQQKYDEALDLLSRSAKLNPLSAETQNYLGITLSHKGMRGPAETALRKAIQLNPGYGSAHNNLAVIYVTQQPPLVELARWHYQKALTAGMPHNPNLEKMLDEKKPAEGSP
ncbi:MAG: tetratricopeptide repeat protein [Verrucomicrobia bacterium]|nr:tetratricopeptide repeat protein [Verrucomicrobiota bacterium]